MALQWYSLVQRALTENELFAPLSLNTNFTSLAEVTASVAVKTLMDVFAAAQLSPQLGFNPSSGEISFMLKIPAASTLSSAAASTTSSSSSPSTSSSAHAASSSVFCFEALRQCLILFMLGIFPYQEEIEQIHATMRASMHVSENLSVNKKDVLANECMLFFFTHAHIAVVSRRVLHRNNTIKIVIESAKLGIKRKRDNMRCSDTQRNMFVFSPCYFRLSGYNEKEQTRSVERLNEQRKVLVEEMERYFWTCVKEKKHYFASLELRECVQKLLYTYFESGFVACGEQKGFLPSCSPLHLYLFGIPGCGKSSFVRFFTYALQKVIRKFLDKSFCVNIVKLTLNAATPSSLRATLLVKGISDWSIERVIEQSLSKGHLVVLHLEEVPASFDLQQQLIGLCRNMLKQLIDRYPEYAALVFTLYTSNYPACPSLSLPCVFLQPLSSLAQQEWCVSGLHALILSRLASFNVATDNTLSYAAAATTSSSLSDLPSTLSSLSTIPSSSSLALASSSVHCSLAPQQLSISLSKPLLLRTKTSTKSEVEKGDKEHAQEENDEYDTRQLVTLQSSVAFAVVKSLQENWKREFCVKLVLSPEDNLRILDIGVSVENDGVVCNSFSLHLKSENGYFFYNKELSPVSVLIQMTKDKFLTPGVLVLTGKQQISSLLSVRSFLECIPHHYTELTVTEEKHKELVFGHHSEIRGGLFKYIDDITNPAVVRQQKGCSQLVVVVLHVNELGQYAVRELLEEGASNTHRLRLHKDRLLFILAVSENLSPPVSSRAHVIVNSD